MERDRKLSFLATRLSEDIKAADFQWSLLVAAISSYRHDTVLRPFPPMYQISEHSKDHKTLEHVSGRVPRMGNLSHAALSKLDDKVLDLLHWGLNTKNFTLKSHSKEMFSEIQRKTNASLQVPEPSHVFEVQYSETADIKFEEIRGNRRTFYAYHGSRVENFHCILHYGLHAHMNKNSLYGEGTYLSSELSVSMPYSPTGLGWEKSMLGDKMSCFAVCEIIDDPATVKCQAKDNQNDSGSSKRARAVGSQAGEVPEKYYVVQSNQVLRVKYIVVYATKSKHHGALRAPSWLSQHRFLVMMLMYGLLLVIVGLYNSKSAQILFKKLLR